MVRSWAEGPSGESIPSEIRITKKVDKSSPNLFQASITGRKLQVSIRVDTNNGRGRLLTRFKLDMSNALISNILTSGTGEKNEEAIVFNFEEMHYVPSSDPSGPDAW